MLFFCSHNFHFVKDKSFLMFRNPLRTLCFCFASVIGWAVGPFLHGDTGQMGSSRLLEMVNERVADGRFVEARPYMEELRSRFAEGTGEEREAIQPLYYFLGLSYMQEYGRTGNDALLKQAAQRLTEYVENNPRGEFLQEALWRRVDAFRGTGEFEKAAADLERLLGAPLRRELTRRREVEALQKITEAYYLLSEWEKGLSFFRAFFDAARDAEERATAASAIIEGLISTDQVDQIFEFLPAILVESPGRYNISLNLSLMRLGDRFSEEMQFSEAALMYDLVLTPSQMIAYFEQRLERLSGDLDRLRRLGVRESRQGELEVEMENARMELERLKEIPDYSAELKFRTARNYFLARRDFEAFWGYYRLIEEHPDHPNVEDFQFAAFMTAMRAGLDEKVRELGERFLEVEGSEEFRRDVFFGLAQSYYEAGDTAEFLEAAWGLVEEFPEEQYTAQILFMLGNHYIEQGDFETLIAEYASLKDQARLGENRAPVYYWLGLGYLFNQSFDVARETFSSLVELFPDSVYVEDARYRYAMAYYADDQVETALELFTAFVADFPEGELRGEVEYFLGEIAASEGTSLEEALAHYRRVEEFTTNQSYIDAAYRQMSDLFFRNGRIEEMEGLWNEYLARHGERGNLPNAIYQLGRAQRMLGKPGEMMASFQRAIFRFGDDPANDGVDQVLREYITRWEETRERLDATIAFIERVIEEQEFRTRLVVDRAFLFQHFSDNPEIEPTLYDRFRDRDELGLPLIEDVSPARELLSFYRQQMRAFPRQSPEEAFRARIPRARSMGQRTLMFRLHMALDEIGASQTIPTVYAEDLPEMSPATLVWFAQRELETNPELAEQAIDLLLEEYPFSESALPALVLRARKAIGRRDYEAALAAFDKAEERFPGHPQIEEVVLGRCEILIETGRYEEARELLQDIRRVPEWRGRTHAQAIFMIGQTFFMEARNSSGEDRERLLRSAHGFFQHTFIMYTSFREWAAQAYLMDSRTLLELGAADDARRTLDEFLEQPEFDGTEAFNEARQMRATL